MKSWTFLVPVAVMGFEKAKRQFMPEYPAGKLYWIRLWILFPPLTCSGKFVRFIQAWWSKRTGNQKKSQIN